MNRQDLTTRNLAKTRRDIAKLREWRKQDLARIHELEKKVAKLYRNFGRDINHRWAVK